MVTYNPFHPHCGPFNAVSKKRSRDPVDEACRQHDIGYSKIGRKAYFYHNRHDDELVKRLKTEKGFLPLFYRKVFQIKKAIAPSLPEKMSNFPPTPPQRKRGYSLGNSMDLDVPMSSRMAAAMARGTQTPLSFSQKMRKYVQIPSKSQLMRIRRNARRRRRVAKRVTKRKSRAGKRKYSRKSRRQKKKWNPTVNKRGSVKKNEYGGTFQVDTNDTLYLGHGLASNEAGKSMCRAIVKEIMRQRKTDFVDWDEPIVEYQRIDSSKSSLTTYVYIVINPGTDASETAYTMAQTDATLTYNQYAEQMWSFLQDSMLSPYAIPYINRIQVNDNRSTGIAYPIATINANQFIVHFSYVSTLKIQNRTLADTHGDPDSNQDTTIDISSNPIVGKMYRCRKHWCNGITPVKATSQTGGSGTSATGQSLTAAKDSGIIRFSGLSEATPSTSTWLKKPPPGWVFGAKDTGFSCSPADFKDMKHRFNCTLNLQQFSKKLWPQMINNEDAYQQVPLGWVDLIAVEKYLDATRTGTKTKIGFQIEQTYMTYGTYKALKTVPIVNSSNIAVTYDLD